MKGFFLIQDANVVLERTVTSTVLWYKCILGNWIVCIGLGEEFCCTNVNPFVYGYMENV